MILFCFLQIFVYVATQNTQPNELNPIKGLNIFRKSAGDQLQEGTDLYNLYFPLTFYTTSFRFIVSNLFML